MKKIFSFALLAVLMIAFASCGKQKNNDYSCDLLNDTIDVFALSPAELLQDGDETSSLIANPDGQYICLKTKNSTALLFADVYNSLIISHNIHSDWQTAERFSEEGTDDIFAEMTESIRLLDCSIIRNDTIRECVQQMKEGAVLFFSDQSEDNYHLFKEGMDNLYAYMHMHFDPILEQSNAHYDDVMLRKAWFAEFDSVLAKRGQSDSVYQQELLNRIYRTKKAEERHVYVIEFAHSSAEHAHFYAGAALVEREFERGEYSPYLMEMWQTWRATLSTYYGMSSWSYIPNEIYNQERAKAAKIIVEHIAAHPEDTFAQALLISLGGLDNVSRFGGMFGNSGTIEQMTMFPEWER